MYPKIGICGFGFVGQAIYNNIKNKDVVIYDPKYSEFCDKDSLIYCDYIFVCVPTPMGNEFDGSYVNNTIDFLEEFNYQGILIIKSTIHPIYIKKNNLNIVSNPEFLNEHSANDDFKNQKIVILGGRADLCEKVKNIYVTYFDIRADYEIMSFEEALIFKYIRNIKIAYEVMFWEFVNDTTGNYRKFNKLLDKMPVKVNNISVDGRRGFGGSCLPKDTAAYPEHILTKFLLNYNRDIR